MRPEVGGLATPALRFICVALCSAALAWPAAVKGEPPISGAGQEESSSPLEEPQMSPLEQEPASPAAGESAAAVAGPTRPPGPPQIEDVRGPAAFEQVDRPLKTAWEQALGGLEAARPHLRARLVGWPRRFLVPRTELPAKDDYFLFRLALDTWRGLFQLRDREHALPVDHVRFRSASIDGPDIDIGDYASGTNIGLFLMSVVGARELGLLRAPEATETIVHVLDTLERLETYRGLDFNYYDTTTLERTTHFVSFVDSAWLLAGLIVARSAVPELGERLGRLIAARDLGFFYDRERMLMVQGYDVKRGSFSAAHYGMLFTEARIGSLIAIGKQEAPEEHWFRMFRTMPIRHAWQTLVPSDGRQRTVHGHSFVGGHYSWAGFDYVPSWGGTMFEALMPALVVDEILYAPNSLGRNGEVHARAQAQFAVEQLGYRVWGLSSSANPDGGYREYGAKVLGAWGYDAGAVTPHASALALAVTPEAATQNLRKLADLYDLYGDYGLYDSLDPESGRVAHAYLALDQSMLFLAIVNHLCDGAIRRYFAADPIARRVLPMLAEENFLANGAPPSPTPSPVAPAPS